MICSCQDINATPVVINGVTYCDTLETVPSSCNPKSCPPGYTLNQAGTECTLAYDTGNLCPNGYTYVYDSQVPGNSYCTASEDTPADCVCLADVMASPQSICSGGTTSIALSSTLPSGVVYSWVVNQTGVNGATSGNSITSGNTIAQTLTATVITSGTAIYTITPYEGSINGCSGTPITVTVTVKAKPNIVILPANSQTIESGDTLNVSLSSQIPGTTFSWTVAQTSGITGASAGSGTAITNTITATSAGTATYTIIATAPNGCTSTATFVANVALPIEQCLTTSSIVVRYQEEPSPLGTPTNQANPCPNQGHRCNDASFNLLLNGVNIGVAYLSNTLGTNDMLNYPPVSTSTGDRYNIFSVNPTQAALIADASIEGEVTYQLTCALSVCHVGVAWVTVYAGAVGSSAILYNGCPQNNFLTINPCTGAIVS